MPSVVENIALEIKRRLEQITTGNGYSFSVCEVVRPDRLGQLIKPEDALIVLNQGDSTRNAEMDRPGNPPAVGYDVEFEINCFVRPSEDRRLLKQSRLRQPTQDSGTRSRVTQSSQKSETCNRSANLTGTITD